ncbi:MAG: FMN-binding protein [Eubacteriales bacterium]|nr:FMN-binding protein [Eubacteriales bacterium]
MKVQIHNQTLNVDAVSGATYSSKGIINAVNNALESAVTEENY